MDIRRTILGILITLVAVVGWVLLQDHYRKQRLQQAQQAAENAPTPASTQPTTTAATGPSTQVATGTNPTTIAATTAPSMTPDLTALTAQPAALTDARPAPLGSDAADDPNYAMGVKLSAYGAGIDNVTLNSFRSGEDFKKPLKERQLYTMEGPYSEDPDDSRPFATAHVIIDGKTVPLAGIPWKLERTSGAATRPAASDKTPATGEQAVYTAVITQAGEPKLKLTKTFTLFQRNTATQGYEVSVDLSVQNLGKTPASVQLAINGPTLPPREMGSRGPDRQMMAGYNDAGRIAFTTYGLEKIKAEAPSLDITKDEKGRTLEWAGTASTYFNAFVLFENPQQIAKVTAHGQAWNLPPDTRPIYLTFDTTPQTLQPGASYNVPMTGFFGPRWRDVVDKEPYSLFPRHYDETLVITSGMCAICTFGWLVSGLVMLLNGFHWLAGGFAHAGDWGLSIILLVALVRTLLHPITKMSQVQMMKMGKMGPALQKLKEKHGDDKEAFTRAQMELMKEQGMAPILGCLPMFLQMPIWIALWQSLQTTFELRQAPFLWGWTWITDLSRPDYLIRFGREIPLVFGMHLDGINLLPILMSIIFHVQARIQNRLQPAGTPEQESQKKMMMWMTTFLFPIFLYNGPSGLNLYILTSTLVGIIESKVIRDHIKQKEAAAKAAGPVVVDGPIGKGKAAAVTAKRGGILGFLQKMAEQAEQMKREQEKKPRGGGKDKR